MSAQPQPSTTTTHRGAAVRFPFPPALFAGPLIGALLLDAVLPLPLGGGSPVTVIGVVLTLGGVAFSLTGTATVLGHHTTVVPHGVVSLLVTSGPFRVSRNPMYTGHAISLLGAALWAGSWWPLVADALAVLLCRQLVILPEEDYLAARFGPEFERYRSRVRRWL